MPKDLAALLLEDGAVSAEAITRALERQREAGGALDTALLEEGALGEEALVGYLARAADLPAAPDEAWGASDSRARRVFPSRVAERHGLAPFALDGRELALVATYPVDLALLDEISFMLSLHLTPHVGPEWRVRELIHRLYGGTLPPRLAALAAAAGSPVTPALDDAAPVAEPSPPTSSPPPRAGFADSEEVEPLAAALQEAIAADGVEEELPPVSAARAAAPEVDPPAEEDAADEEEPAPGPPPDRTAPPRWTLDDARAALAAARDRDEVVLVALRYARDFLEYAAMFAVTRDAVAGHDAIGLDDERDRARTVAIWASDPGIFKTVIETRSPYLGPVSRDAAGTETILSGLGRETPRTVLVHPVLLRDRPVSVLYADNGEAPVSPRRLGDLLLFLSGLGAAFERIIRTRKKRLRRSAAVAPPPAAPEPPWQPENVQEPVPAAEDREAGDRAEPLPAAPPEATAESQPDADADATELASRGAEPEPYAGAEPAMSWPEAEPEPGAGDLPSWSDGDASAPEREPPAWSAAPGEPSPPALEPAAPEDAAAAPPPPRDAAPHPGLGEGASEMEEALASIDVDIDVDLDFGDAATPTADASPSSASPDAQGSGVSRSTAASPAAPLPAPSFDAGEAGFSSRAPPDAPQGPPSAAGERHPVSPMVPPPAVEPVPEAAEPLPAAPDPLPAPPGAAAASASTLADRALDSDAGVATAAREALAAQRREPGLRPANEKLRRALLSGMSGRTARAARAIGAMRDVDAIPLLIQVLETSEPETASAAADALALITLQRLGPDARKWLGWWKENRGRGRAEWLFSGLTSPDRETRLAAVAELSLAAQPPVEYSADLPPAERERLARAWAGWWARSGHVL